MKTKQMLLLAVVLCSLKVFAADCIQWLESQAQRATRVEQAITKALENPADVQAQRSARQVLKLDELNFTYFMTLVKKHQQSSASTQLRIFPATGPRIAYPLGNANTPAEIEAQFQKVEYSDLQAEFDGTHAKQAALVQRPLQAGTGSSLSRESYMQSRRGVRRLLGIPSGAPIVLSAKGSDLLAKLRIGRRTVEVPLTELQILQKIAAARSGAYGQVVHQDLVGPETKNRLAQLWQKASVLGGGTYEEVFAANTRTKRAKTKVQSHVPTLTRDGKISVNRMAPAGHGLFAVDAILEAQAHKPGRLKKIVAISNGEDINSSADPVIVDWIAKNNVPITLVTTSRTSIDKKGGILALVRDSESGEVYLKVIDTAEAEAVGQLELFQTLGGYASTNLTVFNYDALQPLLQSIPRGELLSAIAPDLIPNWKKQKDRDGVDREYLQLEGAMGSVIMNLDRYFRRTQNRPIVQIVNIPADQRSDFFTPIKFAFDYFLQFHSDRFVVDSTTFQLRHVGTTLPSFALTGSDSQPKFYLDVKNVIDSFSGSSFLKAKHFEVKGLVQLRDFVLEGDVKIVNQTDEQLDLQRFVDRFPRSADGRPAIINKTVTWNGRRLSIRSNPKSKMQTLTSSAVAHARVGTAGSHTDYNGGFAIAQLIPSAKTQTRITKRGDKTVEVTSRGQVFRYEIGKEKLTDKWGDYIQGITHVLRQNGHQIGGFDLEIDSTIPMGAGISSSAALVTSVLKSIRRAFALPINNFEIAKMGQKVEHFVGANVGLLDQTTISVLDKDLSSALVIDFSQFTYRKFNLPESAEFTIIHSGMSHSLKDDHGTRNYATRRAQTEEAARILGVPNLSVLNLEQLEAQKEKLPELLYRRAKHVISENEGVHKFLQYAESGDLVGLGQLLSASHASQRDNYDISEPPIDALVEILQNTPGVFGAQLTGGGFGGAVVFLSEKGRGKQIAESVLPKYIAHPSNNGQYTPMIIQGSK